MPESLDYTEFICIFAACKSDTTMLVLQECINKLADFKAAFSQKYSI